MENEKNNAIDVVSGGLSEFSNNIQKQFDEIFGDINDKPALEVEKLKKDGISPSEDDDYFRWLLKREKKYTAIIDDFAATYAKKNKSKLKQRKVFFGTIIGLLIVLVVGSVLSIILSLFLNSHIVEVLIVSLTSILSSVICLPTIIAKYLFDPQEDTRMNELIKGMFEYDTQSRKDYIEEKSRKEK